jgi:hypothetical protein
MRHVNGLSLKNIRVSVRDDDFRPAYIFDDVKNLTLEGGNISSKSTNDQVVLKDSEKVNIKHLIVDGNVLEIVPSYGENSDVEGVKLIKRSSMD